MKRITWKLMKEIEDPKTGSSVSLEGVAVIGTPLQVAVLFDYLFEKTGTVDVSILDQNARDIYNMGVEALENARDSKEWVEWYDDPDLPEDCEDEEDISKWLNSLEKWKVEIIE